MRENRALNLTGKISVGVMLCAAFLLTFTVSDYYIFNRIGQFGAAFCISQWIKKSALLLLPAAIFFGNKKSADFIKYILPIAVIISLCTFGTFFDITAPAESAADEIVNNINAFIPKWLHITLFAFESAAMLTACACLFVRYGYKVSGQNFALFVTAFFAAMPLNIFENFFDIDTIPQDSFLRFGNFTIWHFIAFAALAGTTVAAYYFLKGKSPEERRRWLCAAAGMLLLHYHSKDSMVMGDGYNVYNNVFACIPLFICNIGVYIAALSVFLNKRVLYSMSFFVHAGGAVSVFFYFGKPEMSDYGIFCSYSILYFCLTHCMLFALCVLPSALGIYKFRIKDCIIPLIYYFGVIIVASIASALVTSYSLSLGLEGDDVFMPNYAFTQINPLPFEVPPVLVLRIWKYDINLLYLLGLYAAYVAIFFTFYLGYRAFLALRAKWLSRKIAVRGIAGVQGEAFGEAAASDNDDDNNDKE